MLTKYGDFKFTYQGETFNGRPSFKAIASIGTPEQIIHAVNLLHVPNHAYWIARKIVHHCIDGVLPSFAEDEGVNRLGARRASKDTRAFIINMAKHCVLHGISGKIEDDDDIYETGETTSSETITSFDAYKWIESAIATLNLSMSEAANLTMTEYIARVRATPDWIRVNKDRKKRVDKKRDKAAIDWWEEIKRKDRERAAK